jgi:ATP-dependent RNA helicase DDX55/SPB4
VEVNEHQHRKSFVVDDGTLETTDGAKWTLIDLTPPTFYLLAANRRLHIGYILCQTSQKLLLLSHLLRQESATKKTIVYFATCASVDYFYKLLSKLPALAGFSIHSLHGKMETKKRTLTFKSFTEIPAGSPGVLLCTDVASRGLDIPDVDFVIQVDPPQDPKAFTHRCGRAGRAGREGKAVVFLVRGKEETYVDFLKVRKVPIQRWGWTGGPTIAEDMEEEDDQDGDNNNNTNGVIVKKEPEDTAETTEFLKELRKIVTTDRDLHDKGTMAYVSFIRSYSKHEATFIFRSKDLDLGALARGYGLLRLPRMPELKIEREDGAIDGFTPADIDVSRYSSFSTAIGCVDKSGVLMTLYVIPDGQVQVSG